jgi:hypothetical protein
MSLALAHSIARPIKLDAGAGCTDDTEHEHEGREPDESGIGDLDGLLEQIGTQSWQSGGMV